MNNFLKKNKKTIVAIIIIFALFKMVQSCSRKNAIESGKAKIEILSDSVKNVSRNIKDSYEAKIRSLEDTIKELQYRVKIESVTAQGAEKRAQAIQQTAEKTVRNTTIQIKRENEK